MAELFIPRNVRRFKSIRHFETPNGSHVIVLPTCSVPLQHLVESNWNQREKTTNIGSPRIVRRISKLSSGKLIHDIKGNTSILYVKNPERHFEANVEFEHDRPWIWGAARKFVAIKKPDIRIEKQAIWEARILLGLLKKGIKAEVPQAIVIEKDGRRSVITKGISRRPIFHYNLDKIEMRAEKSGFTPVDLRFNNIIRNSRGLHVIDVNRWEWPPFTNEYRKRLLQAVHEAAKKAKGAKPLVGI